VLIALSHDILITSGVYALVGREVTTSTVAALLTILGYSLYDTIIVFDRIRENVPRMPRATFSQIVNRSMSEVLTRSLVTSLCTLLPIGALMFFGGETLRDFAFALLVGVASGAYSSIFIASPVLTLWKEREPVYVRRRKLIMKENNGVVPPFATETLGDDEVVDPTPHTSRKSRRRRRAGGAPQAATASGPPADVAEPQIGQPAPETGSAPQPAPEPQPASEPEPETENGDDGLSAAELAKRKRAATRARKKHGRR
jgi:SecD/SecF fusion protein